MVSGPIHDPYTHCQKFFPPPLTLTLSPRWGERGKEERTFGKRYNTVSALKNDKQCRGGPMCPPWTRADTQVGHHDLLRFNANMVL